jgi:hypothetical protein
MIIADMSILEFGAHAINKSEHNNSIYPFIKFYTIAVATSHIVLGDILWLNSDKLRLRQRSRLSRNLRGLRCHYSFDGCTHSSPSKNARAWDIKEEAGSVPLVFLRKGFAS